MTKKSKEQALEVWLDADLVSERIRVAILGISRDEIELMNNSFTLS